MTKTPQQIKDEVEKRERVISATDILWLFILLGITSILLYFFLRMLGVLK
jgi:hypothetical protein